MQRPLDLTICMVEKPVVSGWWRYSLKQVPKQCLIQCVLYSAAFFQGASMMAGPHAYKNRTRAQVDLSYYTKFLSTLMQERYKNPRGGNGCLGQRIKLVTHSKYIWIILDYTSFVVIVRLFLYMSHLSFGEFKTF